VTGDELRAAARRVVTMKKLFNIREGWTRKDDTLPSRVLTETLPTGVVQGVGLTKADLDMMIQGYYYARGWTAEGLIPEQKLRELELLDIVQAGATEAPPP
jgi:aldehyde:ferredoxin oxidoreductase